MPAKSCFLKYNRKVAKIVIKIGNESLSPQMIISTFYARFFSSNLPVVIGINRKPNLNVNSILVINQIRVNQCNMCDEPSFLTLNNW